MDDRAVKRQGRSKRVSTGHFPLPNNMSITTGEKINIQTTFLKKRTLMRMTKLSLEV